MHPRILAARAEVAQNKLVAASRSLAERLGITDLADAIEQANHKDPAIASLWKDEAIADFVDSLAQSLHVVGPALSVESVLERINKLGLSKQAVDKINAEFSESAIELTEPEQPSEPVQPEASQESQPEQPVEPAQPDTAGL
jgi:hypothetical protein